MTDAQKRFVVQARDSEGIVKEGHDNLPSATDAARRFGEWSTLGQPAYKVDIAIIDTLTNAVKRIRGDIDQLDLPDDCTLTEVLEE